MTSNDTPDMRRKITALRMTPDLLARLDAYCNSHRFRPTRLAIIVTAIEKFLESEQAQPRSSVVSK